LDFHDLVKGRAGTAATTRKRLGFRALGLDDLLAVVLATLTANTVRKGRGVAVGAFHAVHGVKAIGAGKST
jgi:hypothetical protein